MGLDMYLMAEHYVSEFEDRGKLLMKAIQASVGDGLGEFRPKNVSFELAYWRKANAIHGWFVENVQDGVDECQSSYVPLESLQKLRELCEKILDNFALAPELLPVTKGFFFGGTEYDESYEDDLRKTVAILDKILSNPNAKHWWITYRASW